MMNLNSSCFIYLDRTEVTHAQGKKKLEGFEGLIEEGWIKDKRNGGIEGGGRRGREEG